MSKKSANSGINALSGFEFQRNCALFILLNEIEYFKEKNYFICIEHFDDFLYCFTDDETSNIESVHAYQSKKKSGSLWSIDERLGEIIAKILEVGHDLTNDSHPKNDNYEKKLTFISNTEYCFEFTPNKKEKDSGKDKITEKINEEQTKIKYTDLPEDIKNKIAPLIEKYYTKHSKTYIKNDLDNVYIEWIDFPRTAKEQKEHLVGKLKNNFPHIIDPKAALETILLLFHEVEMIYNQGQVISFLDDRKKLHSKQINQAFEILDNNQLFFAFWRENSVKFIETFDIPILTQRNIETIIANTFELLKDFNNTVYIQIQEFIKIHDYSSSYSSYTKMINKYIEEINNRFDVKLSSIDLLLLVLCAYIATHGF